MSASNFVGRVGGLAVALGVGAAVFSGGAVAWADRGADTGASGGNDSGSSSTDAHPHRGAADTTPRAAAATITRGHVAPADTSAAPVTVPDPQPNSTPVPDAVAVPAAPIAPAAATVVTPAAAAEPETVVAPVVTKVAPEPVDVPALDAPDVKIITDPVIDEPAPIFEDLVAPVVIADPQPETAPADGIEVVAYATGNDGSNDAGTDPSGPVDSVLADLVLAAFVKRETDVAAAATDSPAALVTSSAPSATASSGLTLAPTTVYFDGVLQGNLNVTSASGCGTLGSDCTLTYSFVESSAGGKATLNKVPAALPQGGAGSFTFLPYATWINPDSPTKFPTATGTQDFTVRVSENTKFDQAIRDIPLVGLFTAPIIKLMQDTPFIGDLLAPLIGSAVTQAVSVNVGQLAAGKQVAYTYKVTSFDGTKISMNFFPASSNSLLPSLGNQQATIFNGPGLAAPGETDPYLLIQTAGTVPPLSLMRGQGLPGELATAPLGFNVITWDPRGEFDSGGILQLDSPFFEGRDVSALIDWANANTPLLNENGSPDVAMMGGSYGGGIQMTTVDPRVKAIVPAIAWNSLNQSLYPTDVFKTAWANILASSLVLTGASSLDRINSQITSALITGNLFGFISETEQALLASSGPTVLLTKLNVPTMYDQGTADALFPLAQAVENARTQLEQNPFFAGANADLVKMIWFCGGHGVCTSQTAQQQAAQGTVMFLENLIWVNKYTKNYLAGIPPINALMNGFLAVTAPFQWWDQNGTALASFQGGMPWTAKFQDTPPIVATQATGGRINSFTSMTGPLTSDDAAGAVCETVSFACRIPTKNVFATKAENAVNVDITVPKTTDPNSPSVVVGAPLVSFTYSGIGNAKAVYAQIVDNATGQVLGNINTPIPVTLDGKEHTIDAFPIADIAYTAPQAANGSLTLQIVANSSLYQNTAVIWSVDINKVSVSLPTTSTAVPNPIPGLIPA